MAEDLQTVLLHVLEVRYHNERNQTRCLILFAPPSGFDAMDASTGMIFSGIHLLTYQ